ncbi:MAG TPA: NAD-dependent epimerase/dehydratase family protein, partial [Bacteroidales bacterium]|nr:NAD-dependent epimerase/dehydratase family protein [Bacteroidales bacterium]
MKNILVVGSAGQIGSELVLALRDIYGGDHVIAGIRKTKPSEKLTSTGPCEVVDANDVEGLVAVVKKYNIDAIINMAAILSATGEQNPMLAWDVNMNGLINILEVAREYKMKQVLVPSSIAVFGPS